MPFTFQLTPEGARTVAMLQKGTAPAPLMAAIFALFQKAGSRIAGLIVKAFLSGDPLKRRTGNLAKGLVGGAVMVGNVPGIRVGVFRGPALAYAAIQEHGGTILPKNGTFLAMPVNKALTPAGVDKYGGPRNYPGKLQFIPTKSGGMLFDAAQMKAMKKNWAALKPLYLLLRRVNIPAHHYLSNGLREFLPTVAVDLARLIGIKILKG